LGQEETAKETRKEILFFFKMPSWEILPALKFGRRSGIVLLEHAEADHTAYRSF
jgi:hypothetical protein